MATPKKATEIRDKISHIDNQLHEISEIFAREIDFDGIDLVYLKSKFKSVENTVNRIKGQLKYRK